MTPEQREKLAVAVEALTPPHDRSCFGKRSDFDHYAEGHEYARKAAAECIRKFVAQVEALTVPQWISVEDRLPEIDEHILMCGGSVPDVVVGCLYHDGFWEPSYIGSQCSGDRPDQPTHWMLLPAAPTIPAIPGTKEATCQK